MGNNGKLVRILGTANWEQGDAPLTSTALYNLNVDSPDIAINPSDFKMYGWDGKTRQLFRADIGTGNVEYIGPEPNTSPYRTFGGLYFTASGQLFGYGNDTRIGGGNSQESVVQFNLETGEVTTIGLGISVSANDGASCAFGFELLKDAPDTVALGQVFTYTFTIANATDEVLNDLTFIDDLMGGLTFASNPYNITNGMAITGNTDGLTAANLTIGAIPTGSSTFQIDVITDCTVDMEISNQATLSSEFLTVTSDDPQTAGVTNTTVTEIIDPTITVPNPLVIEGCDISVVNADTAVFPLLTEMSDDIKDVFNTINGYTTTSPQNIASITYMDTVVEGSSCPIVVNRVFTLINTCGVTTTFTQDINVADTTPPTFTVPADDEFDCGEDIFALELIGDVTDEADNCSTGTLEATYTDTVDTGDCPGLMVITRTWSLSDDCGNVTTQDQIITLQDTDAPTFTVPATANVECEIDLMDTSLTGGVTDAEDNCASDLQITFSDEVVPGECSGDSTITRTWSVSDGCNVTEQIQIINVEDTTAPTVNGEFDETIEVNCTEVPEAPELEFSDNCSADVTVTFEEMSTDEDNGEDYVITRTWSTTDDCGNEAVFTQTINVSTSVDITTNDDESICIGDDFNFDLFDLLQGDNIPQDGVWTADTASITLDGSFFNPSQLLNADNSVNPSDVRDYTFTYTFDNNCVGEVSANLNLNDACIVLPCGRDDVEISRAVTVNGDDVNDFFEVKGVENCGFVYELQIFNRWGAKIYENNNYQGEWGGQVSNGAIGSSGLVPTGTYYYILNISNSGFEPIAGPIYVSTK